MRTLPRWSCTQDACRKKNSFTLSVCDSCGTECPTFLPNHPDDWKTKEVSAILGAFRNRIDKIQIITGRGLEGTLTSGGVLAALDSVPLAVRMQSMFLDIGCGRGHVLLAAMVYGFAKVAGLEQCNFREQWELRIKNARKVRASSQYRELWTQSDPQIFWNKPVRDLPALRRCIQQYRWHGLITIYLFWTGWAPNEKLAVLEYIRNDTQVRNVCIADECRRPQGHRRTFDFMQTAGFSVCGQRSGLSISCTAGSETFTLVCWQRL